LLGLLITTTEILLVEKFAMEAAGRDAYRAEPE
jgi:hypothetical protein